MSNTGNKLKMLIESYVGNSRPTDFYFGTMITPTQVQLDSSQGPLPESCCIIPEFLRSYTATVSGAASGEITIDNSLKAGDKVVVLQKPGGQKYLILGRL